MDQTQVINLRGLLQGKIFQFSNG